MLFKGRKLPHVEENTYRKKEWRDKLLSFSYLCPLEQKPFPPPPPPPSYSPSNVSTCLFEEENFLLNFITI